MRRCRLRDLPPTSGHHRLGGCRQPEQRSGRTFHELLRGKGTRAPMSDAHVRLLACKQMQAAAWGGTQHGTTHPRRTLVRVVGAPVARDASLILESGRASFPRRNRVARCSAPGLDHEDRLEGAVRDGCRARSTTSGTFPESRRCVQGRRRGSQEGPGCVLASGRNQEAVRSIGRSVLPQGNVCRSRRHRRVRAQSERMEGWKLLASGRTHCGVESRDGETGPKGSETGDACSKRGQLG
jgi:hypothetical protein